MQRRLRIETPEHAADVHGELVALEERFRAGLHDRAARSFAGPAAARASAIRAADLFVAARRRESPRPRMSTRSTPTHKPHDDPGPGLPVEQHAADSVVIGGDIEIVLLAAKGNQVHLGIIAPEGVPIARSEIYRERSRDY
jgi:carbon storage regulator CsrA